MSNTKAFPTYEWVQSHGQMMAVGGMDLRDYFAAKAMQAIIASTQDEQYFFDATANMAYLMADTMLERRKNAQI